MRSSCVREMKSNPTRSSPNRHLNLTPHRTGMKCLPASKLTASNGVAIHDWHAEVLALRAFNHFILSECQRLAQGFNSDYLLPCAPATCSPTDGPPFIWNPSLTLHMYCSEAPCGDASMELIMAAQADASPWDIPSPSDNTTPGNKEPSLPGRGYFSQLGVVRRKPGRGDAPPSLSKSCSDKISLKQCTSLLSSLTSLLVSPRGVYLSSLVLPEGRYSEAACQRCFSCEEGGRMSPLKGKVWASGYGFVPFRVDTTGEEFEFSQGVVAARAGKTSASNLAVVWTRGGIEEGLVGGVLQGRKQFDVKGASAVSRGGMWKLVVDLTRSLKPENLPKGLETATYDEFKEGAGLEARRAVKQDTREGVLRGWVRNEGGGSFTLR